MEVLLIQPRSELVVPLFGKRYMMSRTLLDVAAALPKEVPVRIIDENIEPVPWDEIGEDTLVGVTALTHAAPRAYEIARIFREKGIQVVLGGIHPTVCSDEALQHVDAVVLGEVEGLWPKILADFESGTLRGNSYKLSQPPDLTDLSAPAWGTMKFHRYWIWSQTRFSRGCPHNCSFCSATAVFGRTVRYRSIQQVIEEIQELKERKARMIFFGDDDIVTRPQRTKELLAAIAPLRIKWIGQGDLRMASDQELLQLLAESGCVGMLVGIEDMALDSSVSRKHKGIDVREAVREIQRHGISLIGCFVFGLPGQTDETFRKTGQYIIDNIEMPQITIATPFPGTRDRKELEAERRIVREVGWEDYSTARVCFSPPQGVAWLERRYDELCRHIYSRTQIMHRVARTFHRHGAYSAYVSFLVNLVYRQLVSFRAT